ncbi:M16 family metallopeptidase [Sphingosinithalassobacter sp. CS137]|uniref:M16 family metallopeptidase n=1 Tax=Sphingosinithalassobacter sp. CS137 TaxID=2762748 RepID=UPI00165E26A5|nr:pitrilysin family protein [Sphingosinithalassobacter sp. CS137]
MKTFLTFLSVTTCALAITAVPATAPVASAQQASDAPAPAPVSELARAIDIPYEEFTLPNGLRVIVHEDRKAPIVAVSTWYDVGSKHEPEGRTGFAHLFEHLMFNGSENAPGDFFEPLREVGATDFNGTTSFDRTNYFETVPRPALERALFLESDRMGYLLGAVTQGVLDEQRGVVQNEKRQGDNQPYGLAWYNILEGVFGEGHPYSHSPIGSMADLDAASLKDVRSWFRSHYGPNNAILVLAGDVDAAEARPLVEKYFGEIPSGPESVLPEVTPRPIPATIKETMNDRVATARIYRIWQIPSLNHEDATALKIAGGVLGGLSSSRLDNVLVRDEQLAVRVSADADTMAQTGTFDVTVDVRPGVDPATVEARLDQIVAEFLAEGPTADEVQRVATSTMARQLAGLESVGGFGGKAVALAQGALYSDDPAFYKRELAELASTTPAEVQAAAREWLDQPFYQLTVVPGAREEQYVEAGEAPAEPPAGQTVAAGPEEGPAPGTRGAMPAVGEIGDLDFPDVTRTRLGNGIELVYAQRDAVPITQMALSFDAGRVADPADKLGLQSLMLSVMSEGTQSRNAVALAEAKERLGAEIGTSSTADRTIVTLYTPSPNLAGSVDLLADVVRNPAFAPAEVERLRSQLLAGISAELTNPGALGMRALPPLVYGSASPYAKLGAGSGDPQAVQAMTRDDLAAFHQAWLRPEKLKIFVVSDRPLAEVQAALEAEFADWSPAGAAAAKAFDGAAVQASPRILLIDRPDSPQSLILGGQLTELSSRDELLPVLTANDVLGSDFLSRINMDLREEKHWSYGAGGYVQRYENSVPYIIQAPVQADKTGEAIVSLRREIAAFLSDEGITPVEFQRTINGNVRELAGGFEASDAVLSAMQQNDLFGRPDDYYETIAQKYRGLTREQLDAAARAALDPNDFVWVVVGDASTVRPQLDSIGLPVEVVPAASVAGAASEAE